jgi:hypothetical protein
MQRRLIAILAFFLGVIGITIPLVVKRKEVREALHNEFDVQASRYGYDFSNPAPYYGD